MKSLICTGCKKEKPEDKFGIKKTSKTGRNSQCKECRNKYNREIWYPKNKEKQLKSSQEWKKRNRDKVIAANLNISLEEAQKFIRKDKIFCDICGSTEKLHYDHCHESGKARGVLCISCNTLLGRMGDNTDKIRETAKKMLEYLEINSL